MEHRQVIATAPSSTANLGPGFDVFGLSLEAFEDKITINAQSEQAAQIVIKVLGVGSSSIPAIVENNCAGVVVRQMSKDFGIKNNLEITLEKKVPAGMGLGSSAASAVAAAMAFNRLFDLGIETNRLLEYAAEGEVVSAGTKHFDNVSASLLGGFTLVRTNPRIEFIKIDAPEDLFTVVAVPSLKVPKKKTELSRRVLPRQVPLKSVVHNVSNASTIVAGFLLKDVQMISKGIDDLIVEPYRKKLIPGYDAVKRNALHSGALAATISGAGPSIISFLKNRKDAKQVAISMSEGFKEAKIECKTFECRISKGAKIISTA